MKWTHTVQRLVLQVQVVFRTKEQDVNKMLLWKTKAQLTSLQVAEKCEACWLMLVTQLKLRYTYRLMDAATDDDEWRIDGFKRASELTTQLRLEHESCSLWRSCDVFVLGLTLTLILLEVERRMEGMKGNLMFCRHTHTVWNLPFTTSCFCVCVFH